MSDGKKGNKGATLSQQIEKLEKQVGPDGVTKAHKLMETDQDVIRLAVKYIGVARGSTTIGLTKSQTFEYNELLSINKDAAEKWRQKKLAARVEKKATKKATKAAK